MGDAGFGEALGAGDLLRGGGERERPAISGEAQARSDCAATAAKC